MANWTNYFRIVTPSSRKAGYTQPATKTFDDGMDTHSSGYASFSTVSWYSNLMRGASSRLARYKQYDSMDIGDVNRALDVIAEEISNADKRTGLPFLIDYQTEESQNIPDTTVTTVRAALRHWSKLQQLSKGNFNIARCMIKYGDCFFVKTSDTKKWEFVHPTRVIGIELDIDRRKVAYHVRPASFSQQMSGNQQTESIEIVPSEAVLHFTLSDEMGDSAPFGISVLQSAFKDWQKLIMLEDASIIYRIVRAPERRVFYIDVGNIPPQRVKQMLEQIKNDIRQKRMPSVANADQTDSQYNPESIQEDIFLPVSATGRGSRVETLPGGAAWEIPELDYFLNKVFRALRVPTSYMRGTDGGQGAQYNDGKVGIAYIEELRFANYIIRLQTALEEVFDEQFKIYLQVTGINIDPDIFTLTLPDPQNFALYRQAALDADLINSFNSIEGVKYLSKRFIMRRYLGLTDDDIQMNEVMLKQERAIEEDPQINELQQMYDPAVYENRAEVTVGGEDDSGGGGGPTAGMEVPGGGPDDGGGNLDGSDIDLGTATDEPAPDAPTDDAFTPPAAP